LKPDHSLGGPGIETATGGCIKWTGLCIAWIGLYGVTLVLLAGIVRDHLLEPPARDGYAAYIALLGFFVIMPIALVVSLVTHAVWKRWWLCLLLALIVAVGTALAPAVLG